MKTKHFNFISLTVFLLINLLIGLLISIGLVYAQEDPEPGPVLYSLSQPGLSDPPTINNYKSALIEENSDRLCGRVWTDKSVYSGKDSTEIDGKNFTNDENFLEVFSAMGSTEAVSGEESAPYDYVLVLDISTSMGVPYGSSESETKIQKTVDAVNNISSFLTKTNPENRIGISVFGTYPRILVPLDHYTNLELSVDNYGEPERKESSQGYILTDNTFSLKAKGEASGSSIENQVSNVTDYEFFNPDISQEVSGLTNIEAGLNEGMHLFLNNFQPEQKNHTPKLILLTDGQATVFNNMSPFNFTNETNKIVPLLDTDENAGMLILQTLMNAAYNKTAVENVYEKDLDITTIGVDIGELKEQDKESVKAITNPKEYFKDTSTPSASKAYEYWQQWLDYEGNSEQGDNGAAYELNLDAQDGPIQVTYVIPELTDGSTENPEQISKEDLIKNICYADHYYEISAADQEQLFSDFTEALDRGAYHPVDTTAVNDFGDTGAITYNDPLGKYMKVLSVDSLLLFGKQYELKERDTTEDAQSGSTITNYEAVLPEGEKNLISNPGYTDGTSFNLADIKVNVITTPENEEILRVTIPEAALPVLRTDVHLGEANESGQREIESLTTNLNTNDALPLRIIYRTGINPELKDENGFIQGGLIDEEYKKNHSNQNGLLFYSNGYSSQPYSEAPGNSTMGDAQVSFIPSEENSFYIAQEDMPVYHSKKTNDETTIQDRLSYSTPVLASEEIRDDEEYCIVKNYYQAEQKARTGSNPLELEQETVALSGKELREHVTYIDLEPETGKERNTGEKVAALKAGSIIHSDLSVFAQTKTDNPTETATLSYGPQSPLQGQKSIHTALGNNGKLVLIEESPDLPSTDEGEPKLEVVKTQKTDNTEFTTDRLTVSEGDHITYNLTITNIGNAAAEDIKIVDDIPEDLKIVENSIKENGIAEGNKITWNLQKLEPGDNVSVSVEVTVPHKDTTTSWENSALFQEKRQINPEKSNTVEAVTESSSVKMIQKSQSVNGDIITLSPVSVKAGDTITYYLTINNTGISRANNITVTDTIPDGMIPIEESISNSGIISDGVIKWNLKQEEIQKNFTLSFSAKVIDDNNTIYHNTGYLIDGANDPIASNEVIAKKVPDDSLDQEGEPDVKLDKKQAVNDGEPSHEKQSVREQDIVTYTLTAYNAGTGEANNVYISDPIPSELQVIGSSISDRGYYDGKRILWNIGTLKAGESKEISFSAKATKEMNGIFKNKALLSHSQTEEPIASNEVVLEPLDEGAPELNIQKTQSIKGETPTEEDLSVSPSEIVSYYLTITNAGTAEAADVLVTDKLPDGLTLIPGSINAAGTQSGGVLSWNIATLSPGESQVLQFDALVPENPQENTWDNTAQIQSSSSKKIISSNTVTLTEQKTDLVVIKKQSTAAIAPTTQKLTVGASDTVIYYLTVENTGRTNAVNITVTDEIPDGLELMEESITSSGQVKNNQITWTLPLLTPGEAETVQFQVKVPQTDEDTNWENTAYAQIGDNQKRYNSNTVILAENEPSVTLQKEQEKDDNSPTTDTLTVDASDIVTYYLTVKNTEETDINNVLITDELPAGLDIIEESLSDGGLNTDGILSWDLPVLKAGETRTLSFKVEVPDTAQVNSWENTAKLEIEGGKTLDSNTVVINKEQKASVAAAEPEINQPETGTPAQNTTPPAATPNTPVQTTSPAANSSPSSVPSVTGSVTQTLSPTASTQVSEAPKTGVGGTILTLWLVLALLASTGILLTRPKKRPFIRPGIRSFFKRKNN